MSKESNHVKRVYDIQRPSASATESQRFRVAMTRKDVIREVVSEITDWTLGGREFYVSIRESAKRKRRFMYHVNSPFSKALICEQGSGRPVLGVIDMILQWNADGLEFDITLLERRRSDRLDKTESEESAEGGKLLQLNLA